MLEIGRSRADAHRPRAQGGDRAAPRASAEHRVARDGRAEIKRRGMMLVLSSPSGAGKTTITPHARRATTRELAMSVSVTTRPRAARRGRRQALSFHRARRVRRDGGDRASCWSMPSVFGNCYGTPRAPVMAALEPGTDIICDVDWQGTQQLAAERARRISSRSSSCRRASRRSSDGCRARAQDSAEVVARAHGEIGRRDEPLARIRLRRSSTATSTGKRARRCRPILAAERAAARSARSGSPISSTGLRRRVAHQARAPARRIPRPQALRRARSASMPAAASSAAAIAAQRFQALAQHLAALAEGGGGDALQQRPIGRSPSGAARGASCTTVEVTLGGGAKACGGTSNSELHLAEPLRQHREPAIGLAAAARRRGAPPPPSGTSGSGAHRRAISPQPAEQQRRRDVVGQVGDDLARRRLDEARRIDLERVAFDDRRAGRETPPPISASAAMQRGRARSRSTRARAFQQQRAGQAARARADLDRCRSARAAPAARAMRRVRLRSSRKFWPSDLLRAEPVAADDLAQRRQLGRRVGMRSARRHGAAPRAIGRRARARRSGSPDWRCPVPAMSKAVP